MKSWPPPVYVQIRHLRPFLRRLPFTAGRRCQPICIRFPPQPLVVHFLGFRFLASSLVPLLSASTALLSLKPLFVLLIQASRPFIKGNEASWMHISSSTDCTTHTITMWSIKLTVLVATLLLTTLVSCSPFGSSDLQENQAAGKHLITGVPTRNNGEMAGKPSC